MLEKLNIYTLSEYGAFCLLLFLNPKNCKQTHKKKKKKKERKKERKRILGLYACWLTFTTKIDLWEFLTV